MENFFDNQAYQIETGIPILQQIVLVKNNSNDIIRCHLKLENTLLSLFDNDKEQLILNTINIANSYLEFTLHVCMGRGVNIQQSSNQLQIFGLTPQLLQILKLYGIQKDFATQYKVIKQIGRGSYGKVILLVLNSCTNDFVKRYIQIQLNYEFDKFNYYTQQLVNQKYKFYCNPLFDIKFV